MAKKRIFSGIQPSGNLHLGNYLGAIQNWVNLQDEFESIFCVVDMHAITVPQDPEELRKKTIEIAKIYLASGIDPKKSSIFIQSHVCEHAELAWVLNTITKNNDLARMTQFKDKAGVHFDDAEKFIKEQAGKKIKEVLPNEAIERIKKNNPEKVADLIYKTTAGATKDFYTQYIIKPFYQATLGLYDYPVLMAADILLYDTEVVPVGEDQLQHIELARDLAARFNHKFGETFIVPKHFVKKEGMRIMGLDDPSKKMSKSAKSEYNFIALTDDVETVRRKIKKAVTDSGSEIVYRDDKPALKNLINIYSLLSGKEIKEIEKMYEGKGYGDFKKDLAEVVVAFLEPLQKKMAELTDEKVLKILEEGAARVQKLAKKKMDEVKKRVGFVS